VVTGAAAHRGGCGLWISSVHRPGSAAQLVKNLPSGTSRVDASGWFRVTKAGRAHDVVPILTLRRRVFPVVSLVRGNHTGRLFLRTTTGPGQTVDRPLGGRIGLGEWHRVQVDVRLRGAHSGVQVRLDGKRLRGGSALTMPSRVATDAVLGTNHRGQQLTIDVDDMVITTRH
jgi:hypothetical protein